MPLKDFLVPNEEIKFQSATDVEYGSKHYQVIVTDKRLILYARRGLVFKSDDAVTEKLDNIQGIKYAEKGIISKKGVISVEGKTRFELAGSASEMKALYQSLMQFF